MPEISKGNSQNYVDPKEVRTRSKFDLSYRLFQTQRFGDITPHFVLETVPGDHIEQRCEHSLRSYTLKEPLLQDIELRKDYFFIANEALLPNTWPLIYTAPVLGDDIDADQANTVIDTLGSYIISALAGWATYLTTIYNDGVNNNPTPSYSAEQALTFVFRYLSYLELFFSRGSLLANLGCNLSDCFKFDVNGGTAFDNAGGFDQFYDAMINDIVKKVDYFLFYDISTSSSNYVLVNGSPTPAMGDKYWTLREYLEYIRDNGVPLIGTVGLHAGYTYYWPSPATTFDWSSAGSVKCEIIQDLPLNYARCAAYNIVCAHFYTNDKIDYVYSAEMYRNYLSSLMLEMGMSPQTYTMNGSTYFYDYLSGIHVSSIFNALGAIDPTTSDSWYLPRMAYLLAIFGMKHSLRYYDYFSGSRSYPLAVGNVDIQVNSNNAVSAVDVTRNIQLQRFLNNVNRSGRRFSEYIKGLFGVSVAPDWHNPMFLAQTVDNVFGAEVENTASNQFDPDTPIPITSNLRSNASRYAFSYDADRPGIVLGVTYYDIVRSYINSTERQFFHVNRFDMFNPYQQFIGDQEVYQSEICPVPVNFGYDLTDNPFGYQMRHMEYKQRYCQAVGGFGAGTLPGLAFHADDGYIRRVWRGMHIGPSFIRSRNSELDRFYIALSGWSLATYFHFIVDNKNNTEASRPMAYAPSIL